jgi:hypothetical protein
MVKFNTNYLVVVVKRGSITFKLIEKGYTLLFNILPDGTLKNGPFLVLPSIFHRINRHRKQKEFLNSCERLLRAGITGHSPFKKIAKMALLKP